MDIFASLESLQYPCLMDPQSLFISIIKVWKELNFDAVGGAMKYAKAGTFIQA